MLFACLTPSRDARSETDLTFNDHGKLVKKLTRQALEKISKPRSITIFEWLEKKQATYRVMPITAILDVVYGKKWKQSDDVIFICADGYRQSVSSAKLKEHRGLLAIDREGGSKGFTLVNQYEKNKFVELGPYYLVWDNLADKELWAEGVDDVPYQVVGLDLLNFDDQKSARGPA